MSEGSVAGAPVASVRSVALMTLKPGVTRAEVEEFEAALRTLRIDGLLALVVHADLGLREGNAQIAVVADLADEAGYDRYDHDAGHLHIRKTIAARITQHAVRIQFAIDRASR